MEKKQLCPITMRNNGIARMSGFLGEITELVMERYPLATGWTFRRWAPSFGAMNTGKFVFFIHINLGKGNDIRMGWLVMNDIMHILGKYYPAPKVDLFGSLYKKYPKSSKLPYLEPFGPPPTILAESEGVTSAFFKTQYSTYASQFIKQSKPSAFYMPVKFPDPKDEIITFPKYEPILKYSGDLPDPVVTPPQDDDDDDYDDEDDYDDYDDDYYDDDEF